MSLESEVRSHELLESAFEKHRHNIDVDNARLAYEAAKEEWDNVTTVETVFRNNLEFRHSVMPHITVHQALTYFQVHDLSVELAEVQSSVEPRGLCTLLTCLLGPPELHDHLTAERDLVFAIAQCKLDMSEPVHVRMLQTVYQRLTGTRMDCPCYGSHWEHIGFQGTDPGTDLRGVGMLGLLQLLYLSNTPHLIPLARDIYRVSVDDQQNFSTCCDELEHDSHRPAGPPTWRAQQGVQPSAAGGAGGQPVLCGCVLPHAAHLDYTA